MINEKVQDNIMRKLKRLQARVMLADSWSDWDKVSEDLNRLSMGIHDLVTGNESEEASELQADN